MRQAATALCCAKRHLPHDGFCNYGCLLPLRLSEPPLKNCPAWTFVSSHRPRQLPPMSSRLLGLAFSSSATSGPPPRRADLSISGPRAIFAVAPQRLAACFRHCNGLVVSRWLLLRPAVCLHQELTGKLPMSLAPLSCHHHSEPSPLRVGLHHLSRYCLCGGRATVTAGELPPPSRLWRPCRGVFSLSDKPPGLLTSVAACFEPPRMTRP